MSELSELEKLVAARNELRSWWKYHTLVDSQSRNNYSLRIDINGVQAMYCGQAYAGASNYHDAPKSFDKALLEHLQLIAKLAAQKVYDEQIEYYDSQIRERKAAIQKELDEVA